MKPINIVHFDIHYDDHRRITAVELKLKSFADEEGRILSGHALIATVSSAFFKTTLLADSGKSLKTVANPKRQNIVNLVVTFKKSHNLSIHDMANFVEAFEKALDETSLTFF